MASADTESKLALSAATGGLNESRQKLVLVWAELLVHERSLPALDWICNVPSCLNLPAADFGDGHAEDAEEGQVAFAFEDQGRRVLIMPRTAATMAPARRRRF